MGIEEEVNDIILLDWHSPASHEPRKYLILVGKKTTALERIRKSCSFVVNFMQYESMEKIIACEKEFRKDKFQKLGLTEAASIKLIDCPRIKEAIAWLECEVERELDVGDHVMFIGRVLHADDVKEAKRPFHVGSGIYTTTRD